MASENRFPTIRDMRDQLSALVDRGLGDLAVQILVCPDSTMQAIAVAEGQRAEDKPALMIEFEATGGRLPVCIISTDRLTADRGMPSITRQ